MWKKNYTQWQSGIYSIYDWFSNVKPGVQDWFNIWKSIIGLLHFNRLKKKNRMVILINAEKSILENLIPTHNKNCQWVQNREDLSQLDEGHLQKSNILLNGGRPNAFPLRLVQGKDVDFHRACSTRCWKF